MAAPRLTESQKQELVARYRQGETAQALASSYGCSPNTVSRVLKAGIDADELASLKKQSRSKTAPQAAPALAVEPVAEAPEPEDEEQSLSAPVAELDAQPAASLEDDEEYGDDIDEYIDDGIEDSFEDDDDEEVSSTFNLKAGGASTQALVDPIPLLPGLLPSSVYMLVDKVVELQAKPLNEFPELGSLPETEQERQALMLYTNPRQAKRQCGRSQRVIKVPDSDVLQRRSSYLVAQGITRLVVEGGLLYSLPGS
ncbi:MAG: helix-turn-helix domain-containing protein [Vulcanococcus sp.]